MQSVYVIFLQSFQFGYISFFLIVWLLWLVLPVLCWIQVVSVGILVLFSNLVGRLSTFHQWVLCWLWLCHKWLLLCWVMVPLYVLWWEFLSWMDVEFYQMIFCVSFKMITWFFSYLWLMWYFTFIDLHILNHLCDSWMNPSWSMVYDPFYVLLDLVSQHFGIYIHQRYWLVI